MSMKPGAPKTPELLEKLANSASWWRRFFASSDAGEIHQIISALSPLELVTLDQRVRDGHQAYKFYDLNNWYKLAPSDVNRLAQSEFAMALVGLASFHSSGYVRDAAPKSWHYSTRAKNCPFS
ncbi:MAG: hypothetical protein P4N60_12165 [Verrucomicrobiae bacterium]|nr:hypothetical protein [Verrucomicrobiae bacterium]